MRPRYPTKQYIQYEEAADVLKMYHGKTVPALAQTKTYAEALLKAAGRADEAETEAKSRMKRQGVLRRKQPPYLWILVDQEVLENVVGGREVMAEQLRYLLELAELDRVCVRVVPRASGWHPGHDGHFQVMTINGRGVSYAVAQVAGRLIEAGDESTLLEVRFDQIGALALPRSDSQILMEQTLRTYE
ncbi:DUF5753 domain-containing protein [Actinomadura luteofluorescens]|uniref:DUF5753 domain-containing protein n=1 Tax=Actinomadura luteofluorescens TaxID=46163 RepID=UPI0030D53B9A